MYDVHLVHIDSCHEHTQHLPVHCIIQLHKAAALRSLHHADQKSHAFGWSTLVLFYMAFLCACASSTAVSAAQNVAASTGHKGIPLDIDKWVYTTDHVVERRRFWSR